MAHWAELDENNVVVRVTVGDNNDPNGDEGYQWLIDNLGGRWVQTSYNGNFRKRFAAIGYTYDENADVFITPQPYPSWHLNTSYDWEAPVPYPDEQKPNKYFWDEESLSWKRSSSFPEDFVTNFETL